MMLQSGLVVAQDVERVGLCSQTAPERGLVAQGARNRHCSFRERKSLMRVDAQPGSCRVVELLHNAGAAQSRPAGQIARPPGVVSEACQIQKRSFVEKVFLARPPHETPISSRRFRRRSRQRCRMKPIEPLANPRLSATCS